MSFVFSSLRDILPELFFYETEAVIFWGFGKVILALRSSFNIYKPSYILIF